MEPRFRDGGVIFARSFARIHETNLKKQGLLPLTFADPATYDQIGEDDRISVLDLAALAPDTPVRCRITKPDGSTIDFVCTHTFSRRADRVVQGRQRAQHHPGAQLVAVLRFVVSGSCSLRSTIGTARSGRRTAPPTRR